MMTTSRPQVVLDTNVWISGLVFGGNPEKIIRLFIDGQINVVTSEELLSELRRKIAELFPLFLPNLGLLEESIREDALVVKLGIVRITASLDATDNVFIETAVTGNAESIISGDKDLLVLGSYKHINILKPVDFLKLYGFDKKT